MESFDFSDYLALVTNTAAFVLAIVAIWLSIVFYKISSQLSESTKEAAKGELPPIGWTVFDPK